MLSDEELSKVVMYVEKDCVRFDSEEQLDAVFAQAREANQLREENQKLRLRAESGWRGLVNINSILGGEPCEEAVALGTATAQAARVMTETERLREDLRVMLGRATLWQDRNARFLRMFDEYLEDRNGDGGTAHAAEIVARLRRENAALLEKARLCDEAAELFEMSASIPPHDPQHQAAVKALGDRIGYGALMCSASRAWRDVLAEKYPGTEGGEFACAPCRSTVQDWLAAYTAATACREEGS